MLILPTNLERDLDSVIKTLQKTVDKYVLSLTDKIDLKTELKMTEINAMVDGLYQALEQSGYNTTVMKSLADLQKTNAKYLADIKARIPASAIESFSKFDQKSLNGLIKMQWLGIETVQAQSIDAIKQAVIQHIITPSSTASLISQVESKIDQLRNHTLAQINTFYREYGQQLENQVAEQIGFGEDKDDIWVYTGAPLQENSHKECIWALREKDGAFGDDMNAYFTDAEKEEFEAGGLYEHTEPRWNCQHRFQITNVTKAEAFGVDPERVETKSINEMTTTKEIEDYFKEKHGIDLKMAGYENTDGIRELLIRFDELATTYKHNYSNIISIDDSKGVYASGDNNRLFLNKYYFENKNLILNSLKKDVISGYHPMGTDNIKSIMTHEFAHGLTMNKTGKFVDIQARYIEAMTKPDKALKELEQDIIKKFSKKTITMEEGTKIFDKAIKETAVQNEINRKTIFISRYSNESIDEFIAEAFTMYKHNPNPSPFAIEVGKIIDKEFIK
jgi:hypothetical protein